MIWLCLILGGTVLAAGNSIVDKKILHGQAAQPFACATSFGTLWGPWNSRYSTWNPEDRSAGTMRRLHWSMGRIGSKPAIFVWTMEIGENRLVFECFCPFST